MVHQLTPEKLNIQGNKIQLILVRNEVCHQQGSIPLNLFSILSKSDNLAMFGIAKNGLNTQLIELQKEIPTRRRYYKALKQLKDGGLIEKSLKNRSTYIHTTYGSIIYQREIVELGEYTKHLGKMKMIDTLRQTSKYSEADIQDFVKGIININTGDGNSPSHIAYKIVWSFEDLVSLAIEKIRKCNTELLIATRFSPEVLINEIIHKSKTGVKVKVMADKKLVRGYFKSQTSSFENGNDAYSVDNGNLKTDKKNVNERAKVIGNPWYPNDEGIQRRICDIPFGVMITDGIDVGIELVNSNNINGFFGGIFLNDEKFATSMIEFYQKMWDKAPSNDPLNGF